MSFLRFLRPPQFEDEEDTRVAQVLNNIQLSLLAMALFALPIVWLLQSKQSAFGLAGGIVFLFVTIWLNRRGYVQLSSLMLVVLVLVVGNFLLIVGQGIHDIATPIYALALIIAGLLLNRRLYFLIMCLVICSANLIILADLVGWIDTKTKQFTNPSDTLIVSAILLAIGLILRLLQ